MASNIEVFPPGTECMLGTIPAKITDVWIRSCWGVQYKVVWWDGATRTSEWVEDCEITSTQIQMQVGFKGE